MITFWLAIIVSCVLNEETYALSFYRTKNVLCQSKYFGPDQKLNRILVPLQKVLCRHKNWTYHMKIIFWSGTKKLELSQYVNQFLVWHKKFGPARNVLGPVKGQGKSASNFVQKTGKSYHNNCQDTTHFEKKVSKTQKSKQIFEKRFETLIFFWDIGSTLDEGTKA